MKRTNPLTLALAGLLALGATELAAQSGPRERGPRAGVDVEAIMAMRERLGLTDGQIDALDDWRRERVATRTGLRSEMDELRSQLRAGQIERSEMLAWMEEQRDLRENDGQDTESRLEAILDAEQLETLEQLRSERRAYQQGRRDARRGGRGAVRGGRGELRGGRDALRGRRDELRGARGALRGGRGGLRSGRGGRDGLRRRAG